MFRFALFRPLTFPFGPYRDCPVYHGGAPPCGLVLVEAHCEAIRTRSSGATPHRELWHGRGGRLGQSSPVWLLLIADPMCHGGIARKGVTAEQSPQRRFSCDLKLIKMSGGVRPARRRAGGSRRLRGPVNVSGKIGCLVRASSYSKL